MRVTLLESAAVNVARDLGIDGRRTAEILSLLAPLASHDIATYEHSLRVGVLAAKVALAAADDGDVLSRPALALTGGMLHDIGKLDVPCAVLWAYKLGPREWWLVHKHPFSGHCKLAAAGYSEEALVAGLHHSFQEHPYGLHPKTIREASVVHTARMVAFCDFFDAIVTRDDARHNSAERCNPSRLLARAYPGRGDWAKALQQEPLLALQEV